MYDVKTAIIGAGFMGPAHTEGLRRLGIHITGILDYSEEASQRAANKIGLPTGYSSLEALLNDKEVDAVHITTPNKLHYAMAKAALLAGKHVFCEKPLAMDSKESAELVEIAAKTGLAAAVNYNLRFYPLNVEIRNMVREGKLGDIYTVFGSYVQDWLLYQTDYNWRVLADEGGKLRAVADIGTHWLDLTQVITGLQVKEVCADLRVVHPIRKRPKGEVETYAGKVDKIQATDDIDISTEDAGCVMLRFDNGAIGALWVSQVTAGRKNSLKYEISASKCAVAWDSEQPNDIWIGYRDKPNQALMRDPGLLSDTAIATITYPGGHAEGYPDTFKQSFKAFYGYIAAGDFSAKKPFPTFDDGHDEIKLCEAVMKSNAEKKWVAV